jgi:TRAP-type C4-dicarboxylate transport system permease small subunit
VNSIQQFLHENPVAFGICIILLGLFLFLGAVFDWNWIFGNPSKVNFNMGKIDGLTNLFGRKTARVVFGVACISMIICGALVIWLCR